MTTNNRFLLREEIVSLREKLYTLYEDLTTMIHQGPIASFLHRTTETRNSLLQKIIRVKKRTNEHEGRTVFSSRSS